LEQRPDVVPDPIPGIRFGALLELVDENDVTVMTNADEGALRAARSNVGVRLDKLRRAYGGPRALREPKMAVIRKGDKR
jgi:hypothetical protein